MSGTKAVEQGGSRARPEVRHRARRGAAIVLAAAAAALLAGCTGTTELPEPTMASSQALETYGGVAAAITGSLTEAFPSVAITRDDDRGPRIESTSGEGCVVVVGPAEARPSLVQAAGGWDELLAVLGPALEAKGFAPVDGERQLDGGWTGISTLDTSGARFELVDNDRTDLTLRIRVTDPRC